MLRPSSGQSASRLRASGQHICSRVSPLLPGERNIQNSFNIFRLLQYINQLYRRSDIQKQYDRHACLIQVSDVILLFAAQIIISFGSAAVFALSCNSADHIYRCRSVFQIFRRNLPSLRQRKRICRIRVKRIFCVLHIL